MRSLVTSIINSISAVIVITLTVLSIPSSQAQTLTVLHNFNGWSDGVNLAGLTMDQAGNLYGTASAGGSSCFYGGGCGVIFKLTHKNSGWIFAPLYDFQGDNDGANPLGRVTIGPNGSLYGTTSLGGGYDCTGDGYDCGTVFNLWPPAAACKSALCPWTETIVHSFAGRPDGGRPWTDNDVVFDKAGNMYGTTAIGGSYDDGAVYGLTLLNGVWTESVLYSFDISNGAEPFAGLIFDDAGNVYGTTYWGGLAACQCGTIFELSPTGSGWKESILYSFQGGADGGNPNGDLVFDQFGNLYGTTTTKGADGKGTVYELSPSAGGWTLTTLYSFSAPCAGLTMDVSGNLYGADPGGGAFGYGNVFKLAPSNGGWVYTDLYDFTDSNADAPCSVIRDAKGNLYGTGGGGTYGGGIVWEITP